MKKTEDLKSLLVIVIGFCTLGLMFKNNKLILLGLAIGIAGLASGLALKGIIWVWTKIAEVLGYINSRILLSAIFYIFLFPIALLSRLGKKNTLHLKKEPGSIFTERNHKYTAADLENVW